MNNYFNPSGITMERFFEDTMSALDSWAKIKSKAQSFRERPRKYNTLLSITEEVEKLSLCFSILSLSATDKTFKPITHTIPLTKNQLN